MNKKPFFWVYTDLEFKKNKSEFSTWKEAMEFFDNNKENWISGSFFSMTGNPENGVFLQTKKYTKTISRSYNVEKI